MQYNEFLKKSKKIVEDLLEILEVHLEELTYKEKELVVAYSFGLMTSMAKEYEVLEEDVCESLKEILTEIFEYKKDEAECIFKRTVKNIKKTGDEEFQIMIYQVKNIYLDYKKKNYNQVYDNITNMMDIIISKKYKNY